MIATTIYSAVILTKEDNAVLVRYRSGEDNVELNEITGNESPNFVQKWLYLVQNNLVNVDAI